MKFFAHPKLSEAAFFIELFEATQDRTESLTRNADLKTEASYLFSAIMNSFYSAIEQWRRSTKRELEYKAFIKKFPEIYSYSHYDGWRSVTVHVRHVPISHAEYLPPKDGEVSMEFSPTPKLASSDLVEDRSDSRFQPVYYVEYKGNLREVVSLTRQHLIDLANLIEPKNELD